MHVSRLLLLGLGTLILSACGGTSTGGTTPGGTNGGGTVDPNACPAVIQTGSHFYTPNSCTAKVGQTITIRASSVHPLIGVAPEGVTNPFGSSAKTSDVTITFTQAGTYRYYCDFHGTLTTGMRGTIVVE